LAVVWLTLGACAQEKVAPSKCDWYDGPTLIEMLDNLKVGGRNPDAALRIPVLDKYTDRGVVRLWRNPLFVLWILGFHLLFSVQIAMGKVESGTVRNGMSIRVMPLNARGKVEKVFINDVEVLSAAPGENIKVKLKGVPEDYVQKGCDARWFCRVPLSPLMCRLCCVVVCAGS
jgi:peptide chain release factor subunit 3